MNIEEKIRNENKEISKSILRIMKDIKTNYGEKGKTNSEEFKINPKEKYNPDDLFKNKFTTNENKNKDIDVTNNDSSIVKYKESFFARFTNKIKKLFKIE